MKFARYVLVLIAVFSLCAMPQKKSASKAATPPAKTAPAASAAKTALTDINSASEKELQELPGIGDAYSRKIVENRPYRAKNELVQKKIIPQATYDKIRDRIIAKQGSGAAKSGGK